MRRETKDDLIRGFLAINAMLREEAKALRRQIAARVEEKYNPNWSAQPRAPRGATDGGQWVDGGGAAERKPPGGKQSRPRPNPARNTHEGIEPFFAPIDDNPYLLDLSAHGLLPSNPSVADFYNLRFELMSHSALEFSRAAQAAGMRPSELFHALNYGSSVMSERAIATVDGLFENPGPGGLNIVVRERRLRDYIARSGLGTAYQEQMFNEIVGLAGFTPEEFEQHKRDIGVGLQLPFLLGGGGPLSTPGIIPRAASRLPNPSYVWDLGPVTRGRIIEAALGHNLPSTFRIIDRFSDDGIVTSIKSVDLRATTYLRARTLNRKIRGFIDQVAGFRGATYARRVIEERQITGRALDLVVPHSGTPAQQEVIDAAIAYGRNRGVTVHIIVYP